MPTFAINNERISEAREYLEQVPDLLNDFIQSKPLIVVMITSFITAVIGFVIGLFLFGWYLTPVVYTPATYADLTDTRKVEIVYLASDLFAYSRNSEQAIGLLQSWGGGQIACQMIPFEQNIDKRERLLALTRVTGVACNGE